MAIQPPMLTLSLDQPEVWAGGALQVTVVVSHGGPAPEDYVLSIRGVDPAWVTLRPPTLSVEAGGQGIATIVIAPPADAASAELILTVRAFAQMSSVVVEATQIALLYGASGAPPVRAVAPVAERRGLAPPAIFALVGGFVVLVLVVGILVFFAVRSKGNSVASAACVARPLKHVDLYSDDVTTAIRISEPDISDLRVLRTESAETLSPLFSSLLSLSPDGSHLAYVTASNEALDDAHLWSLDVANPSQRQELASVPKGMWVVRPAWSADSRQVAFVRYNDQQAALGQSQLELWVTEVGGQPRKVATPAELRPEGFYGDVAQPLCWSQDNRNVIFSSVTRVTTDQSARSTGTARPVVTAVAGGPRQVAVNVLTGSSEALAPPIPVRSVGAGTQPPGTGTSGGVCGLPPFSQNDPTWRNAIMQSSGDSIGRYGCALTATAMVLNYYGGILTPPQLSACLENHADQLAWASVAGCANGAVTGSNVSDFSWPNLDQTLAAGDPAIVGMVRGQTGMHFVVVTSGGGGDASAYTVMDPFDGSTTKTLQTFLTSGYNPRWIRTFAGADRSCPRLVGAPTPAADGTGVAVPTNGPLLVPAQLLPLFTKVAEQTGVPREMLLSLARVESGFTPRAMGPPIAQNSGTEDERALGMMQFLPSTYRTFSAQVDAARSKSSGTAGVYHAFSTQADAASGPLGDAGIWDPEASIWAAAFFLQSHGVAANPRTALSAFTTANAYADLVLRVASQYRAGIIPDDNVYDANGTNKPGTVASPNPVNPPALASAPGAVASPGATASSGGSVTAGTTTGRAPVLWSIPEASIGRREVQLDLNTGDDIGEMVKFTLYTLSQSGPTAGVVNQPMPSRAITPGAIIRDDGVYEAVLVTRQGGAVRVSRRKFTIDRTPPRLDVTVSNGPTTPPPGTAGTSVSGSATTGAASRTGAPTDQSRPSTAGLTRLKISSSDLLSGVAAIEYQLDGGVWQLYFSDDSFKPELFIAAPGNHTVRLRATDLAGNVSTERALDFVVSAQSRATPVPGTSSAPFVPTLLSPTPLPALATPSALPPTTPTMTSVPAATVPLSAIIATAPGALPGAPGAPGAVVGAPGVPGAAGAPGAPIGAPVVVSAPGSVPGAPGVASGPAAAGAPGVAGQVPIVAAGGTAAAGASSVAGAAGGTPGAGAGTAGGAAPAAGAGTLPVVASGAAGTTSGTPGTTNGTPGASGTTTGTAAGTGTAAPTVIPSPTPAPAVSIAPPACPDTLVGSKDTCSLVTVTNSGAAPLTITKAEASGDFTVGDFKSSCGSRISANGSCQIVITFAPSASGSRVGRLTITDNAADSPQSVPLSGRGLTTSAAAPTVTSVPTVTVVPTATPIPAPAIKIDQITCPDTLVNTPQQCSLMTITNTSTATVPINTLSATGEFAVTTQSCATPLAPGAPCQVVITFTPTGLATRVGSLTIPYGGVGSPQTIPLHGIGVAPAVSLTPQTLACPDTHVTQTSTCQAVLSNTGTATLTITNITFASATGGFSIPNNSCGASLGQGATCQIPITFIPPINGSYTGDLTVSDNAVGSPHVVHVTGNGVGGAPAISLTPQSVTCPDTSIAASAASPCTSSVTMTNTGTAPLTITGITVMTGQPGSQSNAVSNDFSIVSSSGQCASSLASGATCSIQITFKPAPTPAPPSTRTAYLTVTDNASGSPQTVQVTGKAIP